MRMRAKPLGTFALVLLVVVVMGIWTLLPAPRESLPTAPRERPAQETVAERAEQLLAQWVAEYGARDLYTRTRIPLRFSRAFSKQFTKACGKVEINFQTARVTVSVTGLEPPSDGSTFEVWLVENGPGRRNAAIDQETGGDRILNLGTLPPTGSLVTAVGAQVLANFEPDAAAVMRLSPNQKPAYVIGGRQSIRFKLGREATVAQQQSAGNLAAAGLGRSRFPTLAATGLGPMLLGSSLALVPAQGQGRNLAMQIARGADLFFNGTFGGNGRTCGTCHPANNNLTIDTAFIATLPPNDPLFVAEFNDPNLPDFDPLFPNDPAIEDPVLMRQQGLILENIDGFATDGAGNFVNPPFFRAVPSLFNLEFTAPFGWSGDFQDRQTFTDGAVVQHFTQSMLRRPGVDFVLPTAAQLADMEAFMLSNRSPANGNFRIAGRRSLLSTQDDPRAIDTSRAEVRGRILFGTVGCTFCHGGTVLSGGNFNIGVETEEDRPTLDTGDGVGRFNTPQLFGLRKQQFFHTGLRGNTGNQFTNLQDAVSFYISPAFKGSPEGGRVRDLSDDEIDDIAAFLEAISVP